MSIQALLNYFINRSNAAKDAVNVEVTGSQVAVKANNGSTLDDWRNNTEGTLLASAARTAVTNSPDMVNHNARALIVYLKVTAASGTGGLTVLIRGRDPINNFSFTLHANPTAVTAIGSYAYIVGLGAGGAVGGEVKMNVATPIPRSWRVTVSPGDASSYTYELSYALIV